MTRWIIFVVVLAIAVTVFALVDSILARGDRVRVFSKPVWILLCIFLPVVGAVLWFAFGRYYSSADGRSTKPSNPKHTNPTRGSSARPPFNAPSRSKEPSIEELEEELRNLEEEIDKNSNKKDEKKPGDSSGKDGDNREPKRDK